MEKLSAMTYALTVATPDSVFMRCFNSVRKRREKKKKQLAFSVYSL